MGITGGGLDALKGHTVHATGSFGSKKDLTFSASKSRSAGAMMRSGAPHAASSTRSRLEEARETAAEIEARQTAAAVPEFDGAEDLDGVSLAPPTLTEAAEDAVGAAAASDSPFEVHEVAA